MYITLKAMRAFEFPAIAQLVERPTVVELLTQTSDGPWFESGLPDLFYINLLTDSVKIGGSATANNNYYRFNSD